MHRGKNLDVAVGARNKRLILASEMVQSDQRGDDLLDAAFAENAQDRAEAGNVPYVRIGPEEPTSPAETPSELEMSDQRWLEAGAIEQERVLKLVGWFLTSPTGVVEKRTGWHRPTIHRIRKQLRTDCQQLVAQAVAAEQAANIAEALRRQRNLQRLTADVKP